MGKIITISREFGSLGRPIAKEVAERLNFKFYDPQLIEIAAKRLNKDVVDLEAYDDQTVIHTNTKGQQYVGMAFPFGMGDRHKAMELFAVQEDLIKEIAEKEDAIIVGRAADYILTMEEKKELLRIHITGSYEHRFQNAVEELGLSPAAARDNIKTIDKARASFYETITKQKFSSPMYRDVIINTDNFSKEYVVDMICNMAEHRFGK